MIYYLKLYAITLIAFLAIDLFWLGVIAKGMYQKYLGYLLAAQVTWWAAFLFYFLFVVGLLVFVVEPGLKANSLTETLWRAALFGLITYATYDLTSHAMVKDWPAIITIVDLIWGMVLSMIVSSISFFAGRWMS
ncbi:MAG: DUF2177 family protein [Gemmatales bacterium]